MNKYPIVIYSDHPEVHFEYRTTARLARVFEEFIHQCEREELVKFRIMLHGYADTDQGNYLQYLNNHMNCSLFRLELYFFHANRAFKKRGCIGRPVNGY